MLESRHLASKDDISLLQTLYDTLAYTTCLQLHRAQMLYTAELSDMNILLIGYGNGVGRMIDVWCALRTQHGVCASLLDIISLKPLDKDMLTSCLKAYTHIFVMSDSYKRNGVGACIMQFAFSLLEHDSLQQIPKIISFEIDDIFVRHGNTQKVEKSLCIDTQSLVSKILESL